MIGGVISSIYITNLFYLAFVLFAKATKSKLELSWLSYCNLCF